MEQKAVALVIAALFVYRLARMIAVEPGPHLFNSGTQGIFTRLREWATTEYGEEGEPLNFWGALLSCPWCLSVWIGLAVTVYLWLMPGWGVWLLLPLALSGAAGLLYSREG